MNNSSSISTELRFSKELIDEQLQKIFADPFFANSNILRKFLSFIVDQTLTGHANWLKEYTIAINVLDKTADFKPQDNGIVRIHAGRLRRALNNYYNNNGSSDNIQIYIPKGRYVPVFTEMGSQLPTGESRNNSEHLINASSLFLAGNLKIIAVLPFQHFNNNPLENSLVDGLGLQLRNALMQFDCCSVAAYYTINDLWKKDPDISKLASIAEINYIIAGNIQTMEDKIRSHIQMIDCNNGIQLCSCMYEGEFASEDIFKLQDEIVEFIIAKLKDSGKLINNRKTTALTILG
jgi:TolB-like protein